MPARIIHRAIQELAGHQLAFPVSLDKVATSTGMSVDEINQHLPMLVDLNFVTINKNQVQLTETGVLALTDEIKI